jgi:uncharacterized protein (UPF0371 family)
MTRHNTATREALRVSAKALRFTESELMEILIRRYLPTLLVDIKAELGDQTVSSNARCIFLAKNCSKHNRRVALIIRSERIQSGWTIKKAAAALNIHERNYQQIEAGISSKCTPNQATRMAKALKSEYLKEQLQLIDWWRGEVL